MAAPKLSRRLVLETPVAAADGAGGRVETWVALGTLWADVTARSGRAEAREGRTASVQPLTIVVRAGASGSDSRPKPHQRFREGERVFRILSVAEQDADLRFLVCRAEEEVGA